MTLTDREKALVEAAREMSSSLADARELRTFLEYKPDTGDLIWKTRSTEHFAGSNNPELSRDWWNREMAGTVAGRVRKDGYRQIVVGRKTYRAHRVAWAVHYGTWPPPHLEIDHINRKRDDNRISNLRIVTTRQNVLNRGMSRNNTSGFNGVSLEKSSGYWVANIRVDGKQKKLGRFVHLADAVHARKTAELTAKDSE